MISSKQFRQSDTIIRKIFRFRPIHFEYF